VCDDIDVELAGLANQRIAALELLDSNVVSHYDAVRSSAGVAVAELKGHRCEGCHLDLSAAEVDTAKEEAAESGYTDCPQCGRMLIV
jgi:predicted  nucleic acid-binding Zn-ribbon protein